MNDFTTDDAWQRQMRDKYLLPHYRRHFADFHFCDTLVDEQRRGIDTIIKIGSKRFTVDEKIVRKQYDAFALETKSCTVPGHEKTGWMFYGDADLLLYCFFIDAGLDCYMMDFQKLRKWFWTCESTFAPFQMDTKNKTAGRVVPIRDVHAAGCIINHFETMGRDA